MNYFEIEACVMRAKNGNHDELLKLLEQYKLFIFKTANRFSIKDYDLYDMLQIGYIALINAVAKYKIGSHTFSSYAYKAIQNAFNYTARQNSKFNDALSLNKTINEDGEGYTEFIDYLEAAENLEEDVMRTEKILEVRRAVSKLPSDEMELVIMVYFSHTPLHTYAKKKGLSYQQAIRKKNKILEKLSRYFNN